MNNLIILLVVANLFFFFSQAIMFVYIYRMLHDVKKLLGVEDTSEQSP